ncbi:MAG: asparagine synthase (glutamine-hydrolyzing) [Candidatus Omnitrophica bacterium]|nr:asparagine synthase (glutamine-hydrolyzing) [Candidatus Omnitrophota bacterium]
MCGIAGYFLKNPTEHSIRNVDLLLEPIRKRGPDDEGVCLISRDNRSYQFYKTEKTVRSIAEGLPHIDDRSAIVRHDVGLINTRYAIIDLSDGGHQPFISRDRSVIVTYNGEIYNYLELKEELSALGVKFRTTSDTEVLVEGYCLWKDKLWEKMNGFWAVVLYDLKDNSIVFSRDRIGVAPLYYRQTPEGLYFSSYIQSLVNISPKDVGIDNDVVLGFAQTGIKDHDDTTFYSGIKSAPQATAITFRTNEFTLEGAEHKRFWNLPAERLTPSDLPFAEAVDKYRNTFFEAVKLRLRADVKVAFELSGGLDSSSIVAAAAMFKNNNITTYTVKIKDADEEPYARSILKKYPVDYKVLADTEEDFLHDFEDFSRLMEEPYDNPSNYNHNRMLQKMKDDGVFVVVTGAGGDEDLAGYETSFWPKAYKELKEGGLPSFLSADWYEFRRRFRTLDASRKTLQHYLVDPLKPVLGLFNGKGGGITPTMTSALEYRQEYDHLSFHQRCLYHFHVALVPYYMRSSDHYTMGIPIEHRFPFLDYRMVELGLSMPVQYLFKNGWTKYILRKAMEPYLPKKIVWRRQKMGFKFPYSKYFSTNRKKFKPLLKYLKETDLPVKSFGNYDSLLKKDPVLLWRLLSTAIWAKSALSGKR